MRSLHTFTALALGALVCAPSTYAQSGAEQLRLAVDERIAGAEDEVLIRVEVTLVGESMRPRSIAYRTVEESAAAHADYVPVSGFLTWGLGEPAEQFIDIPVAWDAESEPDETLRVEFSQLDGVAPDHVPQIVILDAPSR